MGGGSSGPGARAFASLVVVGGQYLSSEQQGQELLYRNGSREVYLVPERFTLSGDHVGLLPKCLWVH